MPQRTPRSALQAGIYGGGGDISARSRTVTGKTYKVVTDDEGDQTVIA